MTIFEKSKIAVKFAASLSESTVLILVSNEGDCLQVTSLEGLEKKDVFEVKKIGTSSPKVKYLN